MLSRRGRRCRECRRRETKKGGRGIPRARLSCRQARRHRRAASRVCSRGSPHRSARLLRRHTYARSESERRSPWRGIRSAPSTTLTSRKPCRPAPAKELRRPAWSPTVAGDAEFASLLATLARFAGAAARSRAEGADPRGRRAVSPRRGGRGLGDGRDLRQAAQKVDPATNAVVKRLRDRPDAVRAARRRRLALGRDAVGPPRPLRPGDGEEARVDPGRRHHLRPDLRPGARSG